MFDEGEGPPLVVIPGIQGRWEWFRPVLRELSRYCRTISYTLCGDFGSGVRYDRALGFDNYLRQLDAVYEKAGIERGAVCGISYGGFIALRHAATRPERVSAAIFASSPGPGWAPNEQQRRYLANPWKSAPSFILTSPGRLFPEFYAAFDTWRERIVSAASHAGRGIRYPMLPSMMAERVTVQQALDFTPDCGQVRCPALVLTGESHLDRIVPVAATMRYKELIPHARYEKLERTGHLGVLTRSRRFAELVGGFVTDAADR